MVNQLVSSVWRRFVGCFLAGLFTILPLIITIAVIIWVANLVKGAIGPKSLVGGWLGSAGMGLAPGGNTLLAYTIGCLFVLAGIFVLGLFVQTGIRKLLHNVVDGILRRIPIAGSVYGAATQIVGLLEKKDDTELKGMSVVYCVFGEQHGPGILALLPTPDKYPINGREHNLVYIPTSPLPMTGGLLFVPVESVQRVDMSVESLMSVYLSMGVTAPQLFIQQKSHLPRS